MMKKCLVLFAFIFSIVDLSAVESLSECQMLWSPEKQKSLRSNRPNWGYMGRAGRLSKQAVEEGFAAEKPEEAMKCFNQAWRFDPGNPMAYWGAMIVRGREGIARKDLSAGQALNDSCKLGKMTGKLLADAPAAVRENFALDYALSLAYYGEYLKKDSPVESKQRFEQAADLLKPLAERIPDGTRRNNMVFNRAAGQLVSVLKALGRNAEAETYMQRLDKHKKLSNSEHLIK